MNGTIINYTIEEINIPNNYTPTYNENTIINTHTPELTNITVSKNWNDSNNQDGIRPDNIIVNLLADGEINESIVLNQSNNWMHEFNNLPKYKNGKLIIYSVNESYIPEGYHVNITNCSNNFNIINTHITENTTIEVSKIWNDTNNQDG
ncbi:MAG: Cna B-type domain-containing protein, partial [Methanosphaera stadtmanae]|nr:Cna B-type domain-containing protein [Methanosphaera stadtmanae]